MSQIQVLFIRAWKLNSRNKIIARVRNFSQTQFASHRRVRSSCLCPSSWALSLGGLHVMNRATVTRMQLLLLPNRLRQRVRAGATVSADDVWHAARLVALSCKAYSRSTGVRLTAEAITFFAEEKTIIIPELGLPPSLLIK